MGDVVSIKRAKMAKKNPGKGSTLCRNGHHKWVIDKEKQFDVKQGKLVTVYRCARCEKLRIMSK